MKYSLFDATISVLDVATSVLDVLDTAPWRGYIRSPCGVSGLWQYRRLRCWYNLSDVSQLLMLELWVFFPDL